MAAVRALFRRRREPAGQAAAEAEPSPVSPPPSSSPAPSSPPLPSLEALQTEIVRLTDENRLERSADRERAILHARHLAGIRLIDDPPAAPEFAAASAASLPSGASLPEFEPGQLTGGLLRAAVLRDGCVLVRGLIDRERALALADGIDAAYERRERRAAGEDPRDGYYDEFTPHERFGQDLLRNWVKEGGGLLGADSPKLTFEFTEALRDAGIDRVVAEYLGEPVLVSSHKTTMRKAQPSVAGQWHQDGRFMGDVRSLNLWLSLSRCGDVAPGLDIVPVRLDHYVATGTEGAALSWTISDDQARAAAGTTPIVRPMFEPGDALLFDELFLHKTGSEPSMPNPRYAIENWFFGASGFPAEYAPIAV
jgi:hypothetical protein